MNLKDAEAWIKTHLNSYVIQSLSDIPEAMKLLKEGLSTLAQNRRLILSDNEKRFVLAMRNRAGTLYDTLRLFREKEISYAMFAHSDSPLPSIVEKLEIQRIEFDRKSNDEILNGVFTPVPARIRRSLKSLAATEEPTLKKCEIDRYLDLLWRNNPSYIKVSPIKRILLTIKLFSEGNRHGGLFLDISPLECNSESRVLFAVGNPPQSDFLLQLMEVYKRLEIGVERAYCLTISNGVHPYFLGAFYVRCHKEDCTLAPDTELFAKLKEELASTQLISPRAGIYNKLVINEVASETDSALINSFCQFAHSLLAVSNPDRFDFSEVENAFISNPDLSEQLVDLFKNRFNPERYQSEEDALMGQTSLLNQINDYSTGHYHTDETRRIIYKTAFLLLSATLKTNYFVLEKQAIAFRLDPKVIMKSSHVDFSSLPKGTPFRITFFCARNGFGYHIGFSDIARGGWRTVIARNGDDLSSARAGIFKETFVLAHTQHFKNKDIYEGGSKLVMLLDASRGKRKQDHSETFMLYKLQYGVANAFLDIFTTRDGSPLNSRVIDYYGEDEAIELGPDENMHDGMIEAIAALSRRRGYMLGSGIMSSKKAGINHKEYGVTSTGVMKFAEAVLHEVGIDFSKDRFSIKFTGGTNGDVAGNSLKILLKKAPQASVRLIQDGTAAIVSENGVSKDGIITILLKKDLEEFPVEHLKEGDFILYRRMSRQEGLKRLHLKRESINGVAIDSWLSEDEFQHLWDNLIFDIKTDIFIPCGGRPETINGENQNKYIKPDGSLSSGIIIEGANSFISPQSREFLQQKGVMIMRDASANKCGVISSSYEILANLLMSDDEFIARKERYVKDVLSILEKRSAAEAELILSTKRKEPGRLMTDISNEISSEINLNYDKLFSYFQTNPALCKKPLYRKVILKHLPDIVSRDNLLKPRVSKLPPKYLFAILSAEIAGEMLYNADSVDDFGESVKKYAFRCTASHL